MKSLKKVYGIWILHHVWSADFCGWSWRIVICSELGFVEFFYIFCHNFAENKIKINFLQNEQFWSNFRPTKKKLADKNILPKPLFTLSYFCLENVDNFHNLNNQKNLRLDKKFGPKFKFVTLCISQFLDCQNLAGIKSWVIHGKWTASLKSW